MAGSIAAYVGLQFLQGMRWLKVWQRTYVCSFCKREESWKYSSVCRLAVSARNEMAGSMAAYVGLLFLQGRRGLEVWPHM